MTTATTIAIPAGTYASDGVHSSAGFAVKHMIATFRGVWDTLSLDDLRADLSQVASTH